MFSDMRIALRTLGRTPAFFIAAAGALALGIGASSAVFSLVNQRLLNPPGISNPGRIVALRAKYLKLNLKDIPVSAPDFADMRRSTQIFDRAAAMYQTGFNYTGSGGAPERLQGAQVTVDWFDVFGARPALGRTFRPEEDQPNANRVVVLAHAAWVRLFGADPSVIGRTIELDRTPYRIAGVIGPEFRWPPEVDLWTPLGLGPANLSEENRFNEYLFAAARMKPGIPFEQANAFMGTLTARVSTLDPRLAAFARDSAWGMFVIPITDYVAGDTKTPLLVLMGAVALVLLLACANIAGLMIARTAGRAREIAMRAALGAGRLALLRQTLWESAILALAGVAAGIALARAGAQLLLSIAPEGSAVGVTAQIDMRVLVFAVASAVISGLIFAAAPAWQVARMDPFETLKGSGRSSAGLGGQRLRSALVIGETAVALVLLAGAGLFMRSLARIQNVSPGFEPRGVITAALSLPESQYKEPERQAAFYRALAERLAALPGATAAAVAFPVPFSQQNMAGSFEIEGRPVRRGDPGPHGNRRMVTPGYFRALGIPLRSGRWFTDQDREGSEPVVVVDENLARQYWPGENALGKRIRQGREGPWRTIVGIVAHVRHSDLAADTGKGVYYYPIYQQPIPVASILVRTAGDPAALASGIRAAVREVDPALPVDRVRTMERMVAESLASRRLVMRLLGFFAAAALLLSALGLYGVIAYSVSRRTNEIGIRMALGAERRSVLGLVIGQGLRLGAAGLVIGLIVSAACSRLLRSQLFEISPFDPATFILTAAVLLATALAACYMPARRASRIEPLEALRYE